jgi:asparagine synthetase B (glutamine-hydrolysing)
VRLGYRVLESANLDTLVATALRRRITAKNVCFALSGGVDSTLLTAIAATRQLVQPLVAYTAVTDAGADLGYAEQAADILGIELRRVEVPNGAVALDFYDDMSTRAGAALSLVGNSIGFAAICTAAKADGFDAIVDGTGAEQMTAGNKRIIKDWLALAEAAGHDDLVSAFVERNGASLLKQARRQGVRFATMAEAIDHELTDGQFTYWRSHHPLTQRATGIEIISPFLGSELEKLKYQPLEWYCPDGWMKSPLRRLLATHVGDAVAYRQDKQGLRWPRKSSLASCHQRMRDVIAESDVIRFASWRHRLAFRLNAASTSRLSRLYEEATAQRVKKRPKAAG